MADSTFNYINEELQLKQEEANRQKVQKQRTAVFNMVKTDGATIAMIQEQLNKSITTKKEQIAGLENNNQLSEEEQKSLENK